MNQRADGNERDAILERNIATMLAIRHRQRHIKMNFFPTLRRTTTIYCGRMAHRSAANGCISLK